MPQRHRPHPDALTAKPSNTVRSTTTRRFLQLLDPAQDQIPLQPAQPFDEQNPIQMVDLMLHAPSQQLRAFDLEALAVHILRPHLHPLRARHLLANIRQAQAALLLHRLAACGR